MLGGNLSSKNNDWRDFRVVDDQNVHLKTNEMQPEPIHIMGGHIVPAAISISNKKNNSEYLHYLRENSYWVTNLQSADPSRDLLWRRQSFSSSLHGQT